MCHIIGNWTRFLSCFLSSEVDPERFDMTIKSGKYKIRKQLFDCCLILCMLFDTIGSLEAHISALCVSEKCYVKIISGMEVVLKWHWNQYLHSWICIAQVAMCFCRYLNSERGKYSLQRQSWLTKYSLFPLLANHLLSFIEEPSAVAVNCHHIWNIKY